MADVSDYRRHLAWCAGLKAAQAGKPETANNRQRGTIYYDDWADGWRSAEPALVRRSTSNDSGSAS